MRKGFTEVAESTTVGATIGFLTSHCCLSELRHCCLHCLQPQFSYAGHSSSTTAIDVAICKQEGIATAVTTVSEPDATSEEAITTSATAKEA